MAISTDKNTNYGPPLVSQKYSPLLNINYLPADAPIYAGLLNNRATMLTAGGMLPRPLDLAVPNWGVAAAAEVGHLPPLVVVSSNRANWILSGINAGAQQLAHLGIPNFANASDLRALAAGVGQTVSPPIYAPARVGANRNVYIVVQMAEYKTYKAVLAGTGITPVGWQFNRGNGGPRGMILVGFGATRFAAMEFCKTLQQQAAAAAGGAAPWGLAWLIDDNVVALTNFAGFAAAEAAMAPADACAGFAGGTSAEAQVSNRNYARGELAAGRGVQVAALPASAPPGIVQQAALWNVNYFVANNLNFGPAYIASAEDLSVANYFNTNAIPYNFYGGITVRKEDPTYDNGTGANNVNAARKRLTAWVNQAEAANPPLAVAPPPLDVQPINAAADGGVQTLATFVVNRVLPNSGMHLQAGDVAVQNNAKCQGVEQMTAGAINQGLVAAAAMNATFRVNGAGPQVVNMRNIP